MSPSWTERQSGFSLLEVLVAFVILALSLGVIMRIFSTSLNNIGRSERATVAVEVARSALARLGVEEPLSEGELSGEDAGYRWTATIRRHAGAESTVEMPNAPALYEIELAVSTVAETVGTPALTLRTLRLAAQP